MMDNINKRTVNEGDVCNKVRKRERHVGGVVVDVDVVVMGMGVVIERIFVDVVVVDIGIVVISSTNT